MEKEEKSEKILFCTKTGEWKKLIDIFAV